MKPVVSATLVILDLMVGRVKSARMEKSKTLSAAILVCSVRLASFLSALQSAKIAWRTHIRMQEFGILWSVLVTQDMSVKFKRG